jgi:hypothetical protein
LKYTNQEFAQDHFLLFFFFPPILFDFWPVPFLGSPFFALVSLFLSVILSDFLDVFFFAALFPAEFFFFAPELFPDLAKDLDPFFEDFCFEVDGWDDLDLFPLEVFAEARFFPAAFLEARLEDLPDRLLASFLPFRDEAERFLDLPLADFRRADFPVLFWELFSDPEELKEGGWSVLG